MSTDLYAETMRLHARAGRSVVEISQATGLKQRWLYRLFEGGFKDPGVKKIQRLHAYLSTVGRKAA